MSAAGDGLFEQRLDLTLDRAEIFRSLNLSVDTFTRQTKHLTEKFDDRKVKSMQQ
jgi:hypothetical protein